MRIDKYLYENNYYSSRNKATEAVIRGDVLVDGKTVKASYDYTEDQKIEIIDTALNYVSNGGYKLKRALEVFGEDIFADKIVADIGASTGGFTQCLLDNGAKKVYCVDVGENQLNSKISQDKRVVVKDNTNARYLTKTDFDDQIEAMTVDVSFISLTYVLTALKDVLCDNGFIVALIKPQFECQNKNISKTGIVKKSELKFIVERVLNYCNSIGLFIHGFTNAPINQGKNIEYLVKLSKNECNCISINRVIRENFVKN